MKRRSMNQSGAVSMLSVLVFAIIITIITTAYIRSVTSQQRNALNYDLGTRAYYAAESGVQDAIRALRASAEYQSNGKLNCDPAAVNPSGTVGADAQYGLGYTCQTIDVQPTGIKGDVDPNVKNVTARLDTDSTVAGPYRLVVRWSFNAANGGNHFPRNTDLPLFPVHGRWNAGDDPNRPVHALLKVSVISHPKTGAFSRGQIKQRMVFLNPTQAASKDPAVTFRIDNDTIAPQQEELTNNAECYPSNGVTGSGFGDYSCKQTIVLNQGYSLANQVLYVRLSSLYRATDFSVELTQNNNTAINLRNAEAVIDVTGRAGGNVFRRVQQRVSLGGYYEDNLPDAALVAGEGICKHFSLGTTTATYQQSCSPLDRNN